MKRTYVWKLNKNEDGSYSTADKQFVARSYNPWGSEPDGVKWVLYKFNEEFNSYEVYDIYDKLWEVRDEVQYTYTMGVR